MGVEDRLGPPGRRTPIRTRHEPFDPRGTSLTPPVDIGSALREARIRKNLTIKDVEDVTKIRGKYLEALEEDDFEVLPGATCVVGFLRTYSSYLKLDADALVDAYKTNYGPRSEEAPVLRTDVTRQPRSRTTAERRKQRVRRQHRSYAAAAVFAIIVVAALAWFGTGRGQEKASLDASSITSSTLTTAAPLMAGSGSSTTSAGDSSDTTDADGSTATTAGDGSDSTTSTTKAGGEATGSTGESGSTTANTEVAATGPGEGAVELVLSVTTESCWVVIREDSEAGAEIYAGTLSAGAKQTFDSTKRYWMMVGNPTALTVLIAGQPYTLDAPAGSFIVTATGVKRVS